MSIFIISDLHLSFATDKTMNIFGEEWCDHEKKIEKNWNKKVKENDTVIIPGDISWAMTPKEAEKDLSFINDTLNGKKIITKGNHDYWWSKTTYLNDKYENITFMKYEAMQVEKKIVCGIKGLRLLNGGQSSDKKLYNRELIRLNLSLKSAEELKKENPKSEIIVIMHYPPTAEDKEESEFTKTFKEHKIKKVYYGHLHTKHSFNSSLIGKVDGVKYNLVSADFLKMKPLRIR